MYYDYYDFGGIQELPIGDPTTFPLTQDDIDEMAGGCSQGGGNIKPEPVNIPEEVLRGSTIIIEDIYKLFMGYSSAKYGLNKNLSISLF